MENPITDEEKREILVLLKDGLPDDAVIVIVSGTGSRFFGWGSKSYDIDVRVVVARKNYWDTWHLGTRMYDMNCEELSHLAAGLRHRYWTIFEDLANPFYVDESFDFAEYQSLCTAGNVHNHMFTIANEVQKFNLAPGHRTALHAYRLQLCPLWFLRTGDIEVNVPKINAELGYSNFIPTLAEEYSTLKRKEHPWAEIAAELDELHSMLKAEAAERTDDLDKEKYASWWSRLQATYYDST